jgi:hypothetical protein
METKIYNCFRRSLRIELKRTRKRHKEKVLITRFKEIGLFKISKRGSKKEKKNLIYRIFKEKKRMVEKFCLNSQKNIRIRLILNKNGCILSGKHRTTLR